MEKVDVRFVAGGTVQAGDGVYVHRDADEFLYNYCRRGEFAYILTSRQMGKSSLMVHTYERLIEEGTLCVIIDLTELGVEVTAEQWYCGFIQQVADQLELPVDMEMWWQENGHLGLAQRFATFFEKVVLTNTGKRVVLFVDEIDSTLQLEFTDDFFASIRYLYNARSVTEDLNRLSFVLIGVASPGDLIKDRERTPFNIGKRVELTDFKKEDAVRSLGVDPQMVDEVFSYTGGHPYLTLRVFRSLAETPLQTTMRDRIESLFLGDQSRRDSNLQYVRDSLLVGNFEVREGESKADVQGRKKYYDEKRERLEKVRQRYYDILRGKRVQDMEADPVCIALGLSGVVRVEGGLLKVRNRIYELVFDKEWVKRNRSINWAKTATWGAVAVFALIVLWVGAVTAPKAWKNYVAVKVAAFQENQEIKDLKYQIERDNKAAQTTLLAQKQADQREMDSLTENSKKTLASVQSQDAVKYSTLDAAAKQQHDTDQKSLIDLQNKYKTDTAALQSKVTDLNGQLAKAKATQTVASAAPKAAPKPLIGKLVVYFGDEVRNKNRTLPDLKVWVDDNHKPSVDVVPHSYFELNLPGDSDHYIMIDSPYKTDPLTMTVHVNASTPTYLKLVPDPKKPGKYMVAPGPANGTDQQKVAPNQLRPIN